MPRILWLLPDPTSAHQPGGVDPPEVTLISLVAMAKRPQSLRGTAAPWRAEVPRGGCRRLTDRVLAYVRTPGSPTGAAQPVFPRPRSSSPLCSGTRLTRSNRRGTDPYARWCGRGDAARRPPIPISGALPSIPDGPAMSLVGSHCRRSALAAGTPQGAPTGSSFRRPAS